MESMYEILVMIGAGLVFALGGIGILLGLIGIGELIERYERRK